MVRFKEMFQRQTMLGEPITVGGVTITPQSQALAIRWPNGGCVWNRPIAVLIERDGQTERVPIVDVTRLVQVGMLGLSVGWVALALIRRKRERSKKGESGE